MTPHAYARESQLTKKKGERIWNRTSQINVEIGWIANSEGLCSVFGVVNV